MLDHPKSTKNVLKMTVIWIFLKNGWNNFDETCSECRTNQFWAPCENRMSKALSVLEIFIHKVQILAENGQSGVQRIHYISRTARAMKNLIWYSEPAINSLFGTSHQIFTHFPSSRLKLDSDLTNFRVFFWWF